MTPAFWRNRRVFLTGHSGFKGSWLSLLLTRLGATVCGYALPPSTEPSLFALAEIGRRVDSRFADIRDLPSLETALRQSGADIVLHLAAQPLVRQSYLDPIGTYATNVMGTANLLQALRSSTDVRAALIITTDKCYENTAQTWGYRENDRLGGHDPYSSSKACAELLVDSFRASFFASDQAPAIASARAGNVIGGGDWAADRLLPDLMRAFIAGQPALVRYPDAVRPWQHVLEPLTGYLLLCERLWADGSAYAEPWNFGPALDDAQSVAQVARQTAALWGQGRSCRIDAGPHPHEAAFLFLDTSKSQRRLGYRPRWDLGQALAATVDWYRAYADGADMQRVCLAQIDSFLALQAQPA